MDEVLEETSNACFVKRPSVTDLESPLNWKSLETRKSLGRTLAWYELALCLLFHSGLFMATVGYNGLEEPFVRTENILFSSLCIYGSKKTVHFVIHEIQNIIYGRIKLFDPIANCYLEYSETYKRNIQFHKKTACILIVCTRKLKNITQNYLWHLERRLLHLSVINEWLFQAKQSQDKVDSRIRIL